MNHEGATHFTLNDRYTLERMLKEGFSKPAIAKALGKCERSIYYEIGRGLCIQRTTELIDVEVYCADVAERKYRAHLRDKGPDLKIGTDHALARRLEELVMVHGFAPGAALAEIRNNGEVFETVICENTLYNYIYRGDVFLNLTPEHLHDNGRRHYAAKSKKQAARAPRGQSIEQRPEEVKGRGSFGHWEMDSIMGCKGSKQALLVLTERRTRMGLVILVEDHTAASVVKAINGLERRFGKLFYKLFKSITVDNGCEFQDFEGIEMAHRRKGKRTVVFFCHPYSAYERGSNENMNRLIIRFFPKGTNFDDVTKEQVAEAERWVNHYPRKLLGWKSAAMLFEEELQAA
jgi:IS30 family transposase